MNIITKTYTVTVTYQGQSQTFSKNLSHDNSLTQEEINQAIINDFYSEVNLEIEPTIFKEAKNYITQQLNQLNPLSQDDIDVQNSIDRFCHIFPIENLVASVRKEFKPPCCPKCSSHTFDGCPACEDYL